MAASLKYYVIIPSHSAGTSSTATLVLISERVTSHDCYYYLCRTYMIHRGRGLCFSSRHVEAVMWPNCLATSREVTII